jgi:stearoyl-CoA desaturase (delta-9 desaturase)
MALLAYCFVLYCLGGLSASVMYHRILTHRIATLQPFFRKVLLVLALPAGTPVQWVGTHRQHHRFADKPGDPHSPALDGFRYAHCGWYIPSKNGFICVMYALAGVFRMYFDGYWRPRTNQEYNDNAIDIQQDVFCAWLSRKFVYQGIMWLYATILLIFGYACFGTSGVVATWLTFVIIYNLGDSINSIGHLSGKPGAPFHKARNNLFLAYITFGEGWHAHHHDRADRANLGKTYPEVDAGYQVMQFFARLGLLKFRK